MMNEKTMRVGLIAVAAFVLIGMLFVPAVAADELTPTSAQNPHYDGSYSIITSATSLLPSGDKYLITYNESTNVLYLSKADSTATATGSIGGSIDLPVLFLALGGTELKNEDVKLIEVDQGVDLKDAVNLFSKFVNAEGLNYFGAEAHVDLFGTTKKIYRIYECQSPVTVTVDEHDVPVENPTSGSTAVGVKPVGTAVLVDTQWAFEGQAVKIAVQPLQNFGVYGWDVYKGGVKLDESEKETKDPADDATLLAEGTVRIVKSDDPEDSATTYIITMPAYKIAPVPKLRDSGSTFVTYVFLNADSYVLEIPADFSLKGIGDSKAVSEKYVELTGCDLLDGHKLTVKMLSDGKYNSTWDENVNVDGTSATKFTGGAFVLKSIRDPTMLGAYTIGTKAWYLPTVPSTFSLVTDDGEVILDTTTLTDEKIYEKLEAKELKTELQFTLKAIDHRQLGKYKDKLTFMVDIGNKTTT